MLNAYFGEWHLENSATLTPHSLDQLNELIDRLAAARTISSYRGGASGHHAWIIVSDHGFNVEAYFGESTGKNDIIDFVLYGPYAEGEKGNIYDGRGLSGEMTATSLKGLLAILDEGRSPVDFVHQEALDVSVVED